MRAIAGLATLSLVAGCHAGGAGPADSSPPPEAPPEQLEQLEVLPPPSMTALEGVAGSPSGPGVEPPNAPVLDPPEEPTTDREDPQAPAAGEPPPAMGAPGSENGFGLGAACILGTRLDTCCLQVVAATPAELAGDECLVAYDRQQNYPPAQLDHCQAPLSAQCALVRCAEPRPPSRRVGQDATGSCTFADECAAASDCILASDHETPCACTQAWPGSVVGLEMCLVQEGASVPPQCPPPAGEDCSCPPASEPRCGEQAGLRVCR